jgi:hypothetical protein
MKSTVYLETSIVSYLAARPSRDLIVTAHNKLPRLGGKLAIRENFSFLQ